MVYNVHIQNINQVTLEAKYERLQAQSFKSNHPPFIKEIQALINECKNDEDKSAKYSIETVKQAISIFGIESIRIYVGGIPDFGSNYKGSLEDRAKDMINPKWKNI